MHSASKADIKRIILYHLDQKPDLKYYINNPYIDELIEVLIEGVSDAIARSNQSVVDKLTRAPRR